MRLPSLLFNQNVSTLNLKIAKIQVRILEMYPQTLAIYYI